MKRVGQLMAELGFNKDAPNSVKEAFLKHLIKASEGVNVTTPSEKSEILANPKSVFSLDQRRGELGQGEQLSFNFDSTGTDES
jgi:hypothetical protein